MINIALVDDHVLLRNGLSTLLKELQYQVVLEAGNGAAFIAGLQQCPRPHLVLLDINMPEMDGYETAIWLKKNHPDIKMLALSMYDDENAIIRMMKNGARGYLLKDCEPAELKTAIEAVMQKGYYHSDLVSNRLVHTLNHLNETGHSSVKEILGLNEREIEFLKWVCTELTYKEIAGRMHLSPRTIDGYRDESFEKLQIKSRVGLVLFTIKNKLLLICTGGVVDLLTV